MSKEKKQTLQENDLNKVNGGLTNLVHSVNCKSCHKDFNVADTVSRVVGNGCGEKAEYKCPHCNTWN